AVLELRAKRPVAAPGVVGVLEELPRGHPPIELLPAEKVVVDPVPLAGAGVSRRGRYRKLKRRQPRHPAPDQCALSHPGGPCEDDDARHPRQLSAGRGGNRGPLEGHCFGRRQWWSSEISSLRCRSESPPIVLEGEIRQWARILLTFTRPYLG